MAGFDMNIPGLKNFVGLGDEKRPNDPLFDLWLGTQNISKEQFSLFSPTEQAGIGESFMNQYGDRAGFSGTSGTGSFGDLGFMGKAKVGIGAAQLGLGVAGYLDNRKTAKLQRENLGVQIESNRNLLATRKARAKDISRTFGLGA